MNGVSSLVLETLVVDNDGESSARATVQSMEAELPALTYLHEPRQNIALARNKAVENARGTWLAFVDDDEVVSEHWIEAYLATARNHPADAYFGPVWARPESPPPSWLDPKLFLDLATFPEGSIVDPVWARTTNVFVRRELCQQLRFDPAFGRTGGSDADFFARAAAAGARLIFSEGAETFEYFPSSKLRLRWILQRSFRYGWVAARMKRAQHPGSLAAVGRASQGMASALRFAGKVPLTILRGRTRAAIRLRAAAHSLGFAWEATGRTYQEY